MNFLEFIESNRAIAAANVRSQRQTNPRYLARLAEATNLIARVVKGTLPMHVLREAMSTSDFPLLFADILSRQLLGNYQATKPVWRNFCAVGQVPDFRQVKRFTLDGAQGALPAVGELEEYQAASLTDGDFTYSVGKFGRRVPISWESLVNDDLNAFRTLPQRLATSATRSESRFAARLYVDANGPHASLYTSAHKNKVTGNPPLSTAGLQTALTVLASQVDADGEPIEIDAVELVVPPALEITAQNILHATELWLTEAGGSTNQQLHTANWMKNKLRLSVDLYIPIVASGANGNTSWFLFANPNSNRPALEVGFISGRESPDILMKAPNAMRVGGGLDETAGDFDTDSFEYKVRHLFGGTQMAYQSTVASNGSGS